MSARSIQGAARALRFRSPGRKNSVLFARAVLSRALDELATSYVQGKDADTLGSRMEGTYGRSSGAYSPSVDLQRSLENRLRDSMGESGSPEFAVGWRSLDMALGEPICRLAGLGRRIGDRGYGGVPSARMVGRMDGWPSPTTPSGGQTWPEGTSSTGKTADGRKLTVTLEQVARVTGWPTASARDWKGGKASERTLERNARPLNEVAELAVPAPATVPAPVPNSVALPTAGWPSPMAGSPGTDRYNEAGNTDASRRTVELAGAGLAGWRTPNDMPENRGGLQANPAKAMERMEQGHALNLDDQVTLVERAGPVAGWTTPQTHDAIGTGAAERLERHGTTHGCKNLQDAAHLTEPLNRDHGTSTTLSAAGTGSTGASHPNPGPSPSLNLNAAFSCWLMGFPPVWEQCAPKTSTRNDREWGERMYRMEERAKERDRGQARKAGKGQRDGQRAGQRSGQPTTTDSR